MFLRVSVCASLSGLLNESEYLHVNNIYLTFNPTGDMLFWNSMWKMGRLVLVLEHLFFQWWIVNVMIIGYFSLLWKKNQEMRASHPHLQRTELLARENPKQRARFIRASRDTLLDMRSDTQWDWINWSVSREQDWAQGERGRWVSCLDPGVPSCG